MADEQAIMGALSTERKRYNTLTEVMELTQELSQAIQRQDQVSVQMFLSMRQQPINQLRELQALRRKQCIMQPELEALLSGAQAGQTPLAQSLVKLAEQNRGLLERIRQADRQISMRLGGKKSFYTLHQERG